MRCGLTNDGSFTFHEAQNSSYFIDGSKTYAEGENVGFTVMPRSLICRQKRDGLLLTGDAFCWNLTKEPIYETSIVRVELITAAYVETANFISSARNK